MYKGIQLSLFYVSMGILDCNKIIGVIDKKSLGFNDAGDGCFGVS
jgi:hypothetical protein